MATREWAVMSFYNLCLQRFKTKENTSIVAVPDSGRLGWFLSADNKELLAVEVLDTPDVMVRFFLSGDGGSYWVSPDGKQGDEEDLEYAECDISRCVTRASRILKNGAFTPQLNRTYGLFDEQGQITSLHCWEKKPLDRLAVSYWALRDTDREVGLPIKNGFPVLDVWWQIVSEKRLRDVTEHVARLHLTRSRRAPVTVHPWQRHWTGASRRIEFVAC